MRWWRRLQDRLEWLDNAEWPDGVSWPEGSPTELPSFARVRWGLPTASIAVVAIVVVIDLPTPIGIAAVFVAASALGGYVASLVVREAIRQGWGSNLPRP
jgi:hypothetical protein